MKLLFSLLFFQFYVYVYTYEPGYNILMPLDKRVSLKLGFLFFNKNK